MFTLYFRLLKFCEKLKTVNGKCRVNMVTWSFLSFFSSQSNPDQSEGSPSTNGNLVDSSSSLEPISSTHGSEISLPRNMLRALFTQEPVMEEDYPPPPPPYHSSTSGQPPPPKGSFSDTSSEGNSVQPCLSQANASR